MRPLDMTLAFKAVALHPELTGTDKRVGAAILEHFNARTGRCDPSVGRLASLLAVSTRTVIRSTGSLEATELFQKERHSGHHNCNSYQPNWALCRERDTEWRTKFEGGRRRAPNLSPPPGQTCHPAGDESVTQTNPSNHSSLTSQGQPKKEDRGTGFRSIGSHVPHLQIRYGDAARNAALRRWTTALHSRFAHLATTYPQIVEAIDQAISDAATEAELKRHGAGVAYIVERLHLEDRRRRGNSW